MIADGTGNFTAAAAGTTSQVGVAPSGGVDTGGGSTSGPQYDGRLALGILGLLGAGVLAVRNRRRHTDSAQT